MPIFNGALAGGADYLDMAMSLSHRHPDKPYELTGIKLGDEQFAVTGDWQAADRLALVGIGVEPGLSDVFARYAADHLFAEIDELGTRDGSNLTVDGYDFAPSFSSGPRSRGASTRRSSGKRATFEYGLGTEFIDVLKALHKVGLDRTDKVTVGDVRVSPRDVVAACLPNPATLGPQMHGKTCAGLWVTGTGKDGAPRSTYLYQVVDNQWSMAEYRHQCVVCQTAVNPVVALELLAKGTWSGTGVLGPEAFEAVPFLDLSMDYGSPWGRWRLRRSCRWQSLSA